MMSNAPAILTSRLDAISEKVDAELLRLLTSEPPVPHLHDGMIYSLGLDVEDRKARGKRIRPALCLLTAEALGIFDERPLAFACAIELLHNFALVHDDIEDGDTMRRGRPCTYLRHGLAHGINIGDYMLAKVFSTVSRDERNPLDIRHALIELLNTTQESLFAGQALDIGARDRTEFTLADYRRVVALKTGSYLAAPMLGAAILAGADHEIHLAIARYGQAIGPLFQIRDDIIDLTSEKGRGQAGNDIREGKRSYLVAAAATAATPDDRARLYAILDKSRDTTTDEDTAWVIDLFQRSGAMAAAEAECEHLRAEGMTALDAMPAPLSSVLGAITDLLARRVN